MWGVPAQHYHEKQTGTKRVESLVVTCLDESSNLSDSTLRKPTLLKGLAFVFLFFFLNFAPLKQQPFDGQSN
ncbi:hypothetical protein HMPREF9331_00926 [Capnocytophaga granulosa ATCC 51502]|nr:hypothetical protein HMPREF9331_00926 [Capnocytophaga granulosa ATCC 51502]